MKGVRSSVFPSDTLRHASTATLVNTPEDLRSVGLGSLWVGGKRPLRERNDLRFVSRLRCHNCVHLSAIIRDERRGEWAGRWRRRLMQRDDQVPAFVVKPVTNRSRPKPKPQKPNQAHE